MWQLHILLSPPPLPHQSHPPSAVPSCAVASPMLQKTGGVHPWPREGVRPVTATPLTGLRCRPLRCVCVASKGASHETWKTMGKKSGQSALAELLQGHNDAVETVKSRNDGEVKEADNIRRRSMTDAPTEAE